MVDRIKNKVAVVIGASQGIGEGIAIRLAEEGAKLVLGDIKKESGEALADKLKKKGSEVLFIKTDISSLQEVRNLVKQTIDCYQRIDILCHVAGIYPFNFIEDISEEEWDRVMNINLKGVFLATQSCIPQMKKQKYGRIVFMSSISGSKVGQPTLSHYCASKAGIVGFMRSASLEVARYNITINAVEPGNILTKGIEDFVEPAFVEAQEKAIPLGRLGQPRDVADAVLFLASDDSKYITGQSIVVDGGQIIPESLA